MPSPTIILPQQKPVNLILALEHGPWIPLDHGLYELPFDWVESLQCLMQPPFWKHSSPPTSGPERLPFGGCHFPAPPCAVRGFLYRLDHYLGTTPPTSLVRWRGSPELLRDLSGASIRAPLAGWLACACLQQHRQPTESAAIDRGGRGLGDSKATSTDSVELQQRLTLSQSCWLQILIKYDAGSYRITASR